MEEKWCCRHCENDKYIDVGQSEVYVPTGVIVAKQSPIIHEICTQCGTVARTYATRPQSLL